MAQSREQEILAKATPRPWTDENVSVCDEGLSMEEYSANQDLMCLAVNSYEADQELIRKLIKYALIALVTEAIGNFVCTSCDHPLRLHLDEYGCEQEGPDIAGNEGVPAHASGPCGCVGGSPAEDALIEALKAAKKG